MRFTYAIRTSNWKFKILYDETKRERVPPKLGSLGNAVFQWKEEGYRSSNDDTKMWESQTRSTTSLKELPGQLELNHERFVNNLYRLHKRLKNMNTNK